MGTLGRKVKHNVMNTKVFNSRIYLIWYKHQIIDINLSIIKPETVTLIKINAIMLITP